MYTYLAFLNRYQSLSLYSGFVPTDLVQSSLSSLDVFLLYYFTLVYFSLSSLYLSLDLFFSLSTYLSLAHLNNDTTYCLSFVSHRRVVISRIFLGNLGRTKEMELLPKFSHFLRKKISFTKLWVIINLGEREIETFASRGCPIILFVSKLELLFN